MFPKVFWKMCFLWSTYWVGTVTVKNSYGSSTLVSGNLTRVNRNLQEFQGTSVGNNKGARDKGINYYCTAHHRVSTELNTARFSHSSERSLDLVLLSGMNTEITYILSAEWGGAKGLVPSTSWLWSHARDKFWNSHDLPIGDTYLSCL